MRHCPTYRRCNIAPISNEGSVMGPSLPSGWHVPDQYGFCSIYVLIAEMVVALHYPRQTTAWGLGMNTHKSKNRSCPIWIHGLSIERYRIKFARPFGLEFLYRSWEQKDCTWRNDIIYLQVWVCLWVSSKKLPKGAPPNNSEVLSTIPSHWK